MFGGLRGRRREISGAGGTQKKSDGGEKRGEKRSFFSKDRHITIEHKLDHQYEGIVVRVIGVEVFHPITAPHKGFRR